jgi:hypothetical protein
VERRRNIRFRVGASAVFSWESSQGKRLRGEGSTRDLCVAGAYVYTATCPPVDAMLLVDILLPRVNRTGPALMIHSEAQVLRVEHPAGDGGRSGFAVASKIPRVGGFELVRTKDSHEDNQQDKAPL